MFGDARPLFQAFLEAELLLPLAEPPVPTDGGIFLRYQTFSTGKTLCAFTDYDSLAAFVGKQNLPQCLRVSGQYLCRVAVAENVTEILLNPEDEVSYRIPRFLYRILAEGFIPGSIMGEDLPDSEMILMSSPSDLPSDEMLARWRVALAAHGAQAAYWFGILLPNRELRFGLGVEVSPAQEESLISVLQLAWLAHWEINAPLHIFTADDPNWSEIQEAGESLL